MAQDLTNLVYSPPVALTLIFVCVAGLLVTFVNLRNARLWLLLIRGRRATGVVRKIEIVTGSNDEVLRRPIVAFRVEEGTEVVSSPALFRPTLQLDKGSTVHLSYAPRRPTRIALHGYDFRLREPIYAAVGLVIAIGIAAIYIKP